VGLKQGHFGGFSGIETCDKGWAKPFSH